MPCTVVDGRSRQYTAVFPQVTSHAMPRDRTDYAKHAHKFGLPSRTERAGLSEHGVTQNTCSNSDYSASMNYLTYIPSR